MIMLLTAAIIAALLALNDSRGRLGGAAGRQSAVQRLPGEAEKSSSLEVVSFDSLTGSSSYRIESGGGGLEPIARAVSGAAPATGTADDSFTELLVFSFGPGDSLELSYSPGRNLLMTGESFYAPAEDIAALLANARRE